MKTKLTSLLVLLSLITQQSMAQYSSNRRIDDVSYEYKNNKVNINYNLVNCKEEDKFMVRVEVYKNKTFINQAKTFTGDVNQVTGGGKKQITWEIKTDGVTFDNEELYFKIFALRMPDVHIGAGLLSSTIWPGAGFRQVGDKNQAWHGVVGYTFLGSSVVLNSLAVSTYNQYKNDMNASLYNNAKTYRTASIVSLGAGVCLWVWNYTSILNKASKTKKLEPQQIINNSKLYETISCISSSKTISTQGLPPNLYAELNFTDANNNGILEAMEKAELKIKISNQGKGAAMRLHVSVKDNLQDANLVLQNAEQDINTIEAGKSVTVDVPIQAGLDIQTAEHKLTIEVTEYYHFDMDPAALVLNTYAFQPAKLTFSGLEIIDAGEGTAAVIEDGQLQLGEQVKLKLVVQNIGQTIAKNVEFLVKSLDPEIRLLANNSGKIGDILSGQIKEIYVTMQVTKRFKSTGVLPLLLTINEDLHRGDLVDFQLPVTLNQKPPQPNVITVKSDIASLQKNVARFVYDSKKFTANTNNIINIKSVTPSLTKRPKSIGVVFGIRKYDDLPDAPYADKDGEIMKDYFEKVLGVEQVIIYTNEEVNGFIFDDIFNPVNGELQKAVVKGETEVFVYYSGHGLPDKTGDNTYLFPSSGKAWALEAQGYNTDKMYENLSTLGAKHVYVLMDACFSGASKSTEKIQTKNLIAQKGVKIKPKNQSWNENPLFTVITSSTNEETSLGFDASETGLFTYFLCAGLQGKADANNDHRITLGELKTYVINNVTATSRKISSGVQTPQFTGDDNCVLVEYPAE